MDNEHLRQTTITSLATAVVTLAGFIAYQAISPPPDPRPDPYTGTQGNELRLELESKIAAHEKSCGARLTANDRRLEQILSVQAEIWQTISHLPPERWRRRIEALEIVVIKKVDPDYDVPD